MVSTQLNGACWLLIAVVTLLSLATCQKVPTLFSEPALDLTCVSFPVRITAKASIDLKAKRLSLEACKTYTFDFTTSDPNSIKFSNMKISGECPYPVDVNPILNRLLTVLTFEERTDKDPAGNDRQMVVLKSALDKPTLVFLKYGYVPPQSTEQRNDPYRQIKSTRSVTIGGTPPPQSSSQGSAGPGSGGSGAISVSAANGGGQPSTSSSSASSSSGPSSPSSSSSSSRSSSGQSFGSSSRSGSNQNGDFVSSVAPRDSTSNSIPLGLYTMNTVFQKDFKIQASVTQSSLIMSMCKRQVTAKLVYSSKVANGVIIVVDVKDIQACMKDRFYKQASFLGLFVDTNSYTINSPTSVSLGFAGRPFFEMVKSNN